MKRAFLTTALSCIGVSLLFALLPSSAFAVSSNQKQCIGQTGTNICSVLVVQLTGTNIPTSGVTVVANRVTPIGIDDSVPLSSGTDLQGLGFPAEKGLPPNNQALPANAYTSFTGIWGTRYGDPGCNTNTTGHPNMFVVTAYVNGSAIGSSPATNLCSPTPNGGFLKSLSIPVTGSNATTGFFHGATSWSNSLKNPSSGNCDASNSYVEIWGGPDSIAQNNAIQVKVVNGAYQSPSNLKIGAGYNLAIHCYDGPTTLGVLLYTSTASAKTLVAGAGGTLVDFKNIGAANGNGVPATTQGNTPSCDDAGGISWLLCPVFNGMADLTSFLMNDLVQPLLLSQPVDTSTSSSTYQVWSSFRLYGDVVLVIGLLVIVFGQSIGGGLLDAYTVKKVLPRILAAAILINLSIYIVALAIDITNIVGAGIGTLLTGPLRDAGQFKFTLSGAQQGGIALGGIVSVAAVVVALVVAKAAVLKLAASLIPWLLLFIILPAVLAMIAAIITIVIRKGLILFLVLISPVAFALYCLPNTEKYFKKWWDLLFKTLLVYPIIMVLFALSDILSVTIMQANNLGTQPLLSTTFASRITSDTTLGLDNILSAIVAFVALFLPLLLIPFAFQLAGGLLGRVHEVNSNYRKRGHEAIKGNVNDPGSLRNRVRRRAAQGLAENNLSGSAIGTIANPTTMFGKRKKLRDGRLAATRNMYQGIYGKQGMGSSMFEYNKDDSNVTGDLAKYATGAASRAAIGEWEAKARTDNNADLSANRINRTEWQARNQTIDRDLQQKLFSSAAADRIGRDPSMRRRALMNPATIGYELSEGEKGWDEAVGVMRDIAGGDEATYRSMKNEFQYVAKSQAGRPDLAGAVDGGDYNGYRAYSTVGLYQHGAGKPRSLAGSGRYFRELWDRTASPQTLTPQDVTNFSGVKKEDFDRMDAPTKAATLATAQVNAKKAVAIFTREMQTVGSNATGATRDEGLNQRAILTDFAAGRRDVNGKALPAQTGVDRSGELRQYTEMEDVKGATRGFDPRDRETLEQQQHP